MSTKKRATDQSVTDTQEIDVGDIIKESSAPPPIPDSNRRRVQLLSEIILRLEKWGWTKIQFQFEYSILEGSSLEEVRLDIIITAEFSYANMRFRVVTALHDECRSIITLIDPGGSKAFTAQEIMERGKRDRKGRRGDVKTTMDLEKKVLEEVSLFLNKIRAEDGTETDASFKLTSDILTNKSSWKLRCTSRLSNDPPQIHTVEGSYTLQSEDEEQSSLVSILRCLSEAIIRGIDPLYTHLGFMLMNMVKGVIARDLPDDPRFNVIKRIIIHPDTEIITVPDPHKTVFVLAYRTKEPPT